MEIVGGRNFVANLLYFAKFANVSPHQSFPSYGNHEYKHHAISALLRVIDEVMKLLNDIEIYTINIASLLYDDYAGILECPISLVLVY